MKAVNYDMIKIKLDHLLLLKEGPMGNYNSSPSCTFHSHCVYEHVSSTDTDGVEYEVM